VPAVKIGALVVNDHFGSWYPHWLPAVSFYYERKETPVNEITSKNIRELDSTFKLYTVIALISAIAFISSVAVENWCAAGVSVAFVIVTCFISYRIEVEIADQKVITQAIEDGRKEKVAQYYRKETSDEEEHSNM